MRHLYLNKLLSKKEKGIDNVTSGMFGNNIDEELEIIERKIGNDTYKPSPYLEKLIVKDRFRSPRLISIPTIRDRLVFSKLKERLVNQCQGLFQGNYRSR